MCCVYILVICSWFCTALRLVSIIALHVSYQSGCVKGEEILYYCTYINLSIDVLRSREIEVCDQIVVGEALRS